MKTSRLIMIGVVACAGLAFFFALPFLLAAVSDEPEAMVMHCVDKNYSKAEHVAVLPEGYHFCAVGCAKDFLESEVTREDFYHDLAKLEKAGVKVQKVFVVDHRPCKGYGTDDSLAAHEENLRRVALVMHKDDRSKHLALELSVHDMKARKRISVKE